MEGVRAWRLSLQFANVQGLIGGFIYGIKRSL
nr:MAG TPA: hypothetical protein [Caudoviricetes sp.]